MTPQLGPLEGDWFKWGLDRETGEFTVWEVGGPGDGLPTHNAYLESAWERSLGYDGRDVLGYVLVDDDGVLVVVYQESEVPAEAVPGHRRASRAGRCGYTGTPAATTDKRRQDAGPSLTLARGHPREAPREQLF